MSALTDALGGTMMGSSVQQQHVQQAIAAGDLTPAQGAAILRKYAGVNYNVLTLQSIDPGVQQQFGIDPQQTEAAAVQAVQPVPQPIAKPPVPTIQPPAPPLVPPGGGVIQPTVKTFDATPQQGNGTDPPPPATNPNPLIDALRNGGQPTAPTSPPGAIPPGTVATANGQVPTDTGPGSQGGFRIRLKGPDGSWVFSRDTGQIDALLNKGYQAIHDDGSVAQTQMNWNNTGGTLIDGLPINTVLTGTITQDQATALRNAGLPLQGAHVVDNGSTGNTGGPTPTSGNLPNTPTGPTDQPNPGPTGTYKFDPTQPYSLNPTDTPGGGTNYNGNTGPLATVPTGTPGTNQPGLNLNAGSAIPTDLTKALQMLAGASLNQGNVSTQNFSDLNKQLQGYLAQMQQGVSQNTQTRDSLISSLLYGGQRPPIPAVPPTITAPQGTQTPVTPPIDPGTTTPPVIAGPGSTNGTTPSQTGGTNGTGTQTGTTAGVHPPTPQVGNDALAPTTGSYTQNPMLASILAASSQSPYASTPMSSGSGDGVVSPYASRPMSSGTGDSVAQRPWSAQTHDQINQLLQSGAINEQQASQLSTKLQGAEGDTSSLAGINPSVLQQFGLSSASPYPVSGPVTSGKGDGYIPNGGQFFSVNPGSGADNPPTGSAGDRFFGVNPGNGAGPDGNQGGIGSPQALPDAGGGQGGIGSLTDALQSAYANMNTSTGLSPEVQAVFNQQAAEAPQQAYQNQVSQLKTQLASRGAYGGGANPGDLGAILGGYAPLMTARDQAGEQARQAGALANQGQMNTSLALNRQTAANAMGTGAGLVGTVGNIYNPQPYLTGGQNTLAQLLSSINSQNQAGFQGIGGAQNSLNTLAGLQPGSFSDLLKNALLSTATSTAGGSNGWITALGKIFSGLGGGTPTDPPGSATNPIP